MCCEVTFLKTVYHLDLFDTCISKEETRRGLIFIIIGSQETNVHEGGGGQSDIVKIRLMSCRLGLRCCFYGGIRHLYYVTNFRNKQ